VYVPDAPAQRPTLEPVIEDGVAGLLYKVNVLAVLVPIQFPAVTLILPETNAAEKLTVTVVVPCPLRTLAFVGAVHVYVVAFATEATLNVLVLPGQISMFDPRIATGVAGFAL
jgi:hypothetical protein